MSTWVGGAFGGFDEGAFAGAGGGGGGGGSGGPGVGVGVGVVVLVVFVVVLVIVGGESESGSGREHVAIHGLLDGLVAGDLGEAGFVDGFAGVFVFELGVDAVVQVVVEVLGVVEHGAAGRAFARGFLGGSRGFLGARETGTLLAAVGSGLLHAVHRGQMSLEDIGSVEALFGG